MKNSLILPIERAFRIPRTPGESAATLFLPSIHHRSLLSLTSSRSPLELFRLKDCDFRLFEAQDRMISQIIQLSCQRRLRQKLDTRNTSFCARNRGVGRTAGRIVVAEVDGVFFAILGFDFQARFGRIQSEFRQIRCILFDDAFTPDIGCRARQAIQLVRIGIQGPGSGE